MASCQELNNLSIFDVGYLYIWFTPCLGLKNQSIQNMIE